MRIILFCILLLPAVQVAAHKADSLSTPDNWFTLDREHDNVAGVSADRVHTLYKDSASVTVVVAIVDSGVDINHADLAGKLWVNPGEVAGNGLDDDKNGYIDDVNGWNFIGGPTGNVKEDTHEMTREYVRLRKLFSDQDTLTFSDEEIKEYEYWKKLKRNFENTYMDVRKKYSFYSNLMYNVIYFDSLVSRDIGKDTLTLSILNNYTPKDSMNILGRDILKMVLGSAPVPVSVPEMKEELRVVEKYYKDQLDYTYNTAFNSRNIVGDNYEDIDERFYGNPDVIGPDPMHGTHVAGIVGANRNNNIGIRGVAEKVMLMPIRIIPEGDERDKDVANAIYYAVDNGARVINLSMGKSYSPGKRAVDKAVKYAEDHGVLIVHASGNNGKDTFYRKRFPIREYQDSSGVASNWIEVGASAWKLDKDLAGSFSNYGGRTVDVFAPGVEMRSTVNEDSYAVHEGTSMAAPVVAGVAAVLWSYYPTLSCEQVKSIILESVYKPDIEVYRPGNEADIVSFSELSISGGIVNAYQALLMANDIVRKKK